jgi:AraC family transcriptional regulator
MTEVPNRYHSRMQKVLVYIDQHLDEDLSLDRLSDVANFSRFHFHRQFALLFGISVHQYVQLLRMKRASWKLAFRKESITDIAVEAGYETPDSFTRAFRKRFGQTPSEFRKEPEPGQWMSSFETILSARRELMANKYSEADVQIVTMPDIPIIYLSHRGEPQRLDETIRKFIAWRKRVGLRAATHPTYTIFHNDPDTVPAEDYRIDLAVNTDRRITPEETDLENGRISGGRCARLRIVGSSDDLRSQAVFLYRNWLPASGEELRDAPLYAERVKFFPDVPEHEAITDLYLPLK